jgi:hypothetical protein
MRFLAPSLYDRAMRKIHIISLCSSLLCGAFVPTVANAVDEEQCSEMVRACLSRPTETRDVCFESASVAPACVGSQVGEIAGKRSHFAPMNPGADEGPAFLGPEVVDRGCLENFDIALGSILEMGPLTSEQRRSLSSQLDRCNQMAPSDLYRP